MPTEDCAQLPRPFSTLYDFYAEDLTGAGVDHRQLVIECQADEPIPFKDNLLWIGYPESMTEQFVKICDWMNPIVPSFYVYPSHKIKTPTEIAAILQDRARQDLIDRYLRF